MKISILQENINTALNYLQKAIPGKPQLPILASVKIEVGKKEVSLSATDLYFGVTTTLHASIDTPGTAVVPGKQFKDLVSSFGPGEITLSLQESTLTLKTSNTTATLQCHPAEEYPKFPETSGQKVSISIDQLGKICDLVSFCASTDEARPVLTSILFEYSDSDLLAVCTDSFRLTKLKLNTKKTGEVGNFLIPAQALREVERIASLSGVTSCEFTVSQQLKQVFFEIDDVQVYVRLIEGEFPPYQKIIPTTTTTKVVFDRVELEDQLKRSLIFARDSSNIVRIVIDSKEGVKILSTSPSLGDFVGDVSTATVTGNPAEIAFNARYVLDFVQALEGDEVLFEMNDSLKPAVFYSREVDDYLYVVMPFKVN